MMRNNRYGYRTRKPVDPNIGYTLFAIAMIHESLKLLQKHAPETAEHRKELAFLHSPVAQICFEQAGVYYEDAMPYILRRTLAGEPLTKMLPQPSSSTTKVLTGEKEDI